MLEVEKVFDLGIANIADIIKDIYIDESPVSGSIKIDYNRGFINAVKRERSFGNTDVKIGFKAVKKINDYFALIHSGIRCKRVLDELVIYDINDMALSAKKIDMPKDDILFKKFDDILKSSITTTSGLIN